MTRKIIFRDLSNPDANITIGSSLEKAVEKVNSGNIEGLNELNGQYGLAGLDESNGIVRLARSVSVPLRYVVLDGKDGSYVFVSDRIDKIIESVKREEALRGTEFHPTYTRMVSPHTLVEIVLNDQGYQDTNTTRFIKPIEQPADIRAIGEAYARAVYDSVRGFVEQVPEKETIGIPMSGGADSGMVYLLTNLAFRELERDPAKLKTFTLKLGEGGKDLDQAQKLVETLARHGFKTKGQWEIIEVAPDGLPSLDEIVDLIEDHKTVHDLQDAKVSTAFRKRLQETHPNLHYTMGGQGGDELCQDYNLVEAGVTFDEVIKNPQLYAEGRIHIPGMTNPMFSGGLGRRIVRDYAPAVKYGFVDFSPICTPRVVKILYGVPKEELIRSESDLYVFKIALTNAGVEAVAGIPYKFPPKNRFQVGASDRATFNSSLATINEQDARRIFYEVMDRKLRN